MTLGTKIGIGAALYAIAGIAYALPRGAGNPVATGVLALGWPYFVAKDLLPPSNIGPRVVPSMPPLEVGRAPLGFQ